MGPVRRHYLAHVLYVGAILVSISMDGCNAPVTRPTIPIPQGPCSYEGARVDAVYDMPVPLSELENFLTPMGWKKESLREQRDSYIFGSYKGVGVGARMVQDELHVLVETTEQSGEDHFPEDLSRVKGVFGPLNEGLKKTFQIAPVRVEEHKKMVCPQ